MRSQLVQRSRRALAVVITVAVLAACGSTVPPSGHSVDVAAGDQQGLGLPAGAQDSFDVSGGADATAAGPSSGGAPGAPSTDSPAGVADPSAPGEPRAPTAGGGAAGPSGPGGGQQPAPATSGPGFTADKIFIGVAYDSTLSSDMAAIGISPGQASVGDQRKQVNAVVADINRRGGVAGRKLVPLFYDTRGQNDPSTAAQAACAAWTQDHRVFAAMTYVVQIDNATLFNCLARSQVLYIPLGGVTSATLTRYAPYLWVPSDVAIDRYPATWVKRLSALRYFDRWNTALGQRGSAPVKVGILYGDGARNNEPAADEAFVGAVERALAANGHAAAAKFQITNNTSDPNAAVLRFASDGITHVVGDFSLALFAPAAESQGYRPRYGFSSRSGGIVLALVAPPGQLRGALGVGWRPAGDVDTAQDPGDVSKAEAHCRQVMEGSQQSTSNRLAWFAMTITCDTLYFIATAVNEGGVSPAGVQRGAVAAGPLPPASTFAISFPRGRPDGASAVRDLAYDESCGCFVYLSARNRRM